MTYSLTLDAEEDLIRIYRYGEGKFGQTQALKYYLGLIEHFERIAENPYQFVSVAHIKPDYRSCNFKSDTIYYTVTDNVLIVAIIGRQDIEGKL